jgi:hypothetical protein
MTRRFGSFLQPWSVGADTRRVKAREVGCQAEWSRWDKAMPVVPGPPQMTLQPFPWSVVSTCSAQMKRDLDQEL